MLFLFIYNRKDSSKSFPCLPFQLFVLLVNHFLNLLDHIIGQVMKPTLKPRVFSNRFQIGEINTHTISTLLNLEEREHSYFCS